LYYDEFRRTNAPLDDLVTAKCLREIANTFATTNADELDLEALIPIHLRVPTITSKIDYSSASVYIALHPLITDLSVCTEPLSPSPPSKRIVHVIKMSASVVIDHFTRVNEARSITSISQAAEQVFLAGLVWISGLLYDKHTPPMASNFHHSHSSAQALTPILRVSSLLASFAARWQAGDGFVSAWNIVVDLLWQAI
jgi:hypothetical protein